MEQLYVKIIQPRIVDQQHKTHTLPLDGFKHWYPESKKEELTHEIEKQYKPDNESRIHFHRHFGLRFIERFVVVGFDMSINAPDNFTTEVGYDE